MSIYPIAAEGLATDSLYDAGNVPTAFTNPSETQRQQIQEQQTRTMRDDSTQRNADHSAMELIAKDTGGEAIYNANGLNDALARVIERGSHYYTLAYTPSNTAADGKFRKLQVKLVKENIEARESVGGKPESGYKLAYRRGYYASGGRTPEPVNSKRPDKHAAKLAAKQIDDPLHPFMGPGMPDSTQIPFDLRIRAGVAALQSGPESTLEINKREVPSNIVLGRMKTVVHTDAQPGDQEEAPVHAGDNTKLKGPLTRYTVDFVVAARGLQLDPAPDGGRRGSMETTMVIYDREGRALNWLVRQIDLDIDAARYEQVRENGVNFRLEIDAPKGSFYLRSGVYDRSSNLTGTLEIPLSSVLNGQAPGLKAR